MAAEEGQGVLLRLQQRAAARAEATEVRKQAAEADASASEDARAFYVEFSSRRQGESIGHQARQIKHLPDDGEESLDKRQKVVAVEQAEKTSHSFMRYCWQQNFKEPRSQNALPGKNNPLISLLCSVFVALLAVEQRLAAIIDQRLEREPAAAALDALVEDCTWLQQRLTVSAFFLPAFDVRQSQQVHVTYIAALVILFTSLPLGKGVLFLCRNIACFRASLHVCLKLSPDRFPVAKVSNVYLILFSISRAYRHLCRKRGRYCCPKRNLLSRLVREKLLPKLPFRN